MSASETYRRYDSEKYSSDDNKYSSNRDDKSNRNNKYSSDDDNKYSSDDDNRSDCNKYSSDDDNRSDCNKYLSDDDNKSDDDKKSDGNKSDDDKKSDDNSSCSNTIKKCCPIFREATQGEAQDKCVKICPQIGPSTKKLLKGNKKWAKNFCDGNLPIPPSKRCAVIMCMDARMPQDIFGREKLNGEYHWIRNAGGLMDLRSIIISQVLLGTNEILIVHHADCGMQRFYGEELEVYLQKVTGQRVRDSFKDFTVSSVDALSLAKEIMYSPFIPQKLYITVSVYNDKTGVIEVIAQPSYVVNKPFKIVPEEISPLVLGNVAKFEDRNVKYTQVQCKDKRVVAGVGPTKCELKATPKPIKPYILSPHKPCPPVKCAYN